MLDWVRFGSRSALSATLALTLVLAACGGDGGSGDDDPAAGAEIEDLTANPADFDRLVELARDEGRVVWYTSLASEEADTVGAMFQDEYGIEVIVHRSGGEDLLQRFLLEADSGRVQNDVLTIQDAAAVEAMMDDGYFECFRPRFVTELHDWAYDQADGCWTATRGSVFVIGYRTDLVEQAGAPAPTSWADLLRPEFSGRIAIGNPNFSSGLKQATALLSESLGWEWFEGVRDNGAFVVRGNAQLFDALETGEALVMGPAAHTRLAQAVAAGEPMAMAFPTEGVILAPSPNVIPSGAPNPYAARLFLDFLLTDEVLDLLVDTGSYVGRAGFPPPPSMPPLDQLELDSVDYGWLNANADDRAEAFTTLFDAETQ